jgi:hypothetical protein
VRYYLFPLVVFSTLMLLMGCATKGKPIESSVFLLSTDKSITALLNELSEDLKANKYEIETLNTNLGVLNTKPRRFLVRRGDQTTPAEQTVQIRQEGGSVQLRLLYQCDDGLTGMGPCMSNDVVVRNKIARIENLLITTVNRRLFKDRSQSVPANKLID